MQHPRPKLALGATSPSSLNLLSILQYLFTLTLTLPVLLGTPATAAPIVESIITLTDLTPTPTETSIPSNSVDETPVPTCSLIVCVDYINECNIFYGECFLAPECGGTWPVVTPPPCARTTAVGYDDGHGPGVTSTAARLDGVREGFLREAGLWDPDICFAMMAMSS
ncbi:hypothetical protein DFH27DRAFT_527306 [Peziza echinospora]|nr:hypothetical protein DFH27DRAFT_527306 [Peziza echinospora]